MRRVVTEPVGDGLQHSGELELLAFGDGAAFHKCWHLPSQRGVYALLQINQPASLLTTEVAVWTFELKVDALLGFAQ
ncbi:hypothetical protein D3C87_1627330 [compost metagenome]